MGKLVKESLYEKFLTICRGVLFGILVVKVCFIGENQAATVSGRQGNSGGEEIRAANFLAALIFSPALGDRRWIRRRRMTPPGG